MSMTPFPVEQFGSLDLLQDPTELGMGGAVDMLNADMSRVPGQLVTRAGLKSAATGTAAYHRILGLFSTKSGGSNITVIAARNTGSVLQLDSVRVATGLVTNAGTTWGDSTTRVTASQVLQISGSTIVAIASRSGTTNAALHQADGTTTSLVGSPRYVAMTPWDDRFVQAHFTSAAGSPTGANGSFSTLVFSDPSAYMTYGANNWISLSPGDGEEISGMVAWKNLLFVIKRRQMFVFYGTSVASDGTPVFNYRTVALPTLTRETVNGGGENIVAASDGVYLLLSDGVYRTTGDVPVKISRPINPIFDGTGPTSLLFPTSGDWNIGYAANRIYLTYPSNGTFRTFVYDTVTGVWLPWDLTIGGSSQPTNVLEWPDANQPAAFVAVAAKILKIDPNTTTDNGTAISGTYQTGYSNAGGYFRARIISSGERKRHFKTDIEGSGTVTHQVLALNARPNDLADPGGSVTLGTAPAIVRGSRRRGVRGTYFSHRLTWTGPVTITGLTYWLANVESDT